MSNHLGETYWCPVCKTPFIMKAEYLDGVELSHVTGEELSVTTCSCPTCESMCIVEGMNQIAWLLPGQENE